MEHMVWHIEISYICASLHGAVQKATLQNLGVALLRSRVQYDAAVRAAFRGAAASSATRQAALRVMFVPRIWFQLMDSFVGISQLMSSSAICTNLLGMEGLTS